MTRNRGRCRHLQKIVVRKPRTSRTLLTHKRFSRLMRSRAGFLATISENAESFFPFRKKHVRSSTRRRRIRVDLDNRDAANFFNKLLEEISLEIKADEVAASTSTSIDWKNSDCHEVSTQSREDGLNTSRLRRHCRKARSGAIKDVEQITILEPDLPFANKGNYNDEEWSNLKLLYNAYGKCQMLQNCGLYQFAFSEYCKLLSFFSADPLFWLRIAECCIYARYKVNSGCFAQINTQKRELKDDSLLFMSLFLNNDLPCRKQRNKLDEEGMTLEYAEIALNNCILLLNNKRFKYIRDHATTLASFVALKTNRFRHALLLLRRFNLKTNPQHILRALLIEAEIDLHEVQNKTKEKVISLDLLSRTACNQKDSDKQWYALILGHATMQNQGAAERIFEVYKKHARPHGSDLILGAILSRRMNMSDQFCKFLDELFRKQ